jgi:hypothetical protein
MNPATGKRWTTIAPLIAGFDWLSAAEKKAIFGDSARKVFKLDV